MRGFEWMGVPEAARMLGKTRQRVLKMIQEGILEDTGYMVLRLQPKTGKRRTLRYAIGVPQTHIEVGR